MTAVMKRVDRFLTKHFTRPSITWRESVAIVLPLIAENLFTVLFGLLNTGMISSSGVTSLSAVSLVDTLNNFLFVFYIGIATGAGVIVANYRGRGDQSNLHEACLQAVTSVTLFTLLTSLVVILFNRPLLQILFGAAEEEVMEKAQLYLLGGALTLPMLGITTAISGVLRGIGEGKIALVYTGISTAVYVALNVLFLSILKLGIPGLILSVTINRVTNLPLLLFLMKKGHSHFSFRFRELFHLNFKMLGSILKIGMPCAMESLFFSGGRLVTQSIIVPLGTNAIVTYNVSYSLLLLSQCAETPLSTAMFTVSGICMGKDRPEDIRSLLMPYGIFNTLGFVVNELIVMALFTPLVSFYNAPAETISDIFVCILLGCIFQAPTYVAAFLLPSVFRAVGDGNYCTIVSLIIMWIVRVFGGYVLGIWCGLGVVGVWSAMILDWLVRVIVFPLRLRSGKWLNHQAVV